MRVREITNHLESIASLEYQEDYDNSGLIVGSHDQKVTKVLITLDCIEEVVNEAISKKCELIIAHHPIIFRGLKKINGKNYVERTILKAIKNDIAIYAIHTNLDNVDIGVNRKIAEKLGIKKTRLLQLKEGTLSKLVAFCPKEYSQIVLDALHKAGAGNIGNYSQCSFTGPGVGAFRPGEASDPFIGRKGGQVERVNEERIEVIINSKDEKAVLDALFESHPYEEVAYYLHRVDNKNQSVGAGMIGDLERDFDAYEFLNFVKDKMALKCFRHTSIIKNSIRKIAICGGSGSFLLSAAKREGADAFITSDFKYHEFFDAEEQLIILDIGHFESEVFTKDLVLEFLTQKFTNIALVLSEVDTNPVKYF
ncbi:MAG: Nif3-like dinuclear metal center hexameric protein [Bacteroidetes bacterium]|nr:Nif3-like dinuclear metal center hexameric protein [Bacteroidota bacterium]MDA1119756.1 Nif3-like dinuclear metal center hexameric protein [Bacteroidota bacterium]